MHLILLGAPGAGKGTQAVTLSKTLGIAHISTGDIFRLNIKENTSLGKSVRNYLESGSLVPDDITLKTVKERILHEDCKKGFLFDGFPRTITQAQQLDKLFIETGKKLDAVINIEVKDEIIIKRVAGRRICSSCSKGYHVITIPPKKEGVCDACQGDLIIREDDKEETVLKRLKTYNDQTKPLVDYYKQKELLIELDGTKEISFTTKEILISLKELGF